jgi:selenoprotein W-related protein
MYTPRAVSLTTAILKDFEAQISNFTLVPSEGGRFEFSINGDLIFSKLKLGRHAEPGEINQLMAKYIEEHAA